jgi:DNA polymerase III delta prime subunit
MILSVTEAKNMMYYDKRQLERKIYVLKNFIRKHPNDKQAKKKLNGLEEALKTTEEYINHYSQVEKMLPQDKREKSDFIINALRGGELAWR